MNSNTANSDRFLQAFNRVEQHLRREAREDKFVSFGRLVREAEKRDRIVRRYAADLHEFADLRNAIVHETTDSHVIAEPNDRTVEHIEAIAAALSEPPLVAPDFIRKVITVTETTPIGEAVGLLKGRNYSQLPVTKQGKFYALLTTNTVARWLGAAADEINLAKTSVAKVLEHAEDDETHVFVAQTATQFDVLEAFEHPLRTGKVVNALLITHSGKAHEKIVGIVTAADLPAVLGALELTDRDRG